VLTCAVLSGRSGTTGQDLVPDGLWRIVEPLIPSQRERPEGGRIRHVEDWAVFPAIVYLLPTGCA